MKSAAAGGGRTCGRRKAEQGFLLLGVILRMLRPLALRCCSSRAARCCSIIFWKKPDFFFWRGKHGHGQAADKGRLSYGDQILRGPVQGQGGSEIVTEQEEHHRHQVHNNALGAFPRLRRHPHLDNHGYGHDERQNIDWNAEQVAHGIRQGKGPSSTGRRAAPQFCGILEHTVKGKRKWESG